METFTGNETPQVDLTNCDREQIQFAAHVQPFGCLIAVSSDWMICHASLNVEQVLGAEAEKIIGTPLADLVSTDAIRVFQHGLQISAGAQAVDRHFDIALLTATDTAYDVGVHQINGTVILDIEPHDASDATDHVALIGSAIRRATDLDDFDALLSMGVQQVKALTGFDRVMLYKFHPDDTGEVMAEAVEPQMEPFVGLRYPASDIPRQARALYRRNLLRIISDVDARPYPIIPEQNPRGEPLDLSLSGLRAVSPIHLQYLRNMGVRASMSISLIVDGKLWGLIACHHTQPHVLHYRLRSAAELWGQMFGFLIENHISRHARQSEERGQRLCEQLSTQLAPDRSIPENFDLIANTFEEAILHDGIVAWIDGVRLSRGAVPDEEQLEELVKFINTAAANEVYATDHLSKFHSPAEAYRDVAAGVLALPVSRTPRDYVLLFRREVAQSVSWAGNPNKPVTVKDGTTRLTPRESFAAWQEIVRGQSTPWDDGELALADSLRAGILEVVLRMSDATNEELRGDQERQEVLIAELNHRVRNILNLIRSMISQSASDATSIGQYTQILGGRIQAIGTAHDLITEVNWEASSFKRFIETEFAAYVEGHSDRLVINGNDARIAPKALTTLALVMHEMTTNSVKYGALNSDDGIVTIELERSTGGDLTIRWRESGGPQVTPPTRRGFGSTIIEKSISYELKGSTELNFAPEGLQAVFNLPAALIEDAAEDTVATSDAPPVDTAPQQSTVLSGEALLLEDNMIIALDAEQMLQRMGAKMVHTAANVAEAQSIIGKADISFAVLDVNLGSERSDEVARTLLDAGVPFVFATGYGQSEELRTEFPDSIVVTKPFSEATLAEAISKAVDITTT